MGNDLNKLLEDLLEKVPEDVKTNSEMTNDVAAMSKQLGDMDALVNEFEASHQSDVEKNQVVNDQLRNIIDDSLVKVQPLPEQVSKEDDEILKRMMEIERKMNEMLRELPEMLSPNYNTLIESLLKKLEDLDKEMG